MPEYEITGDEAYGDEAYGDETLGDEAYGDEAYGDETLGDGEMLGAFWRRRRQSRVRPQRRGPRTRSGERIYRKPPLPQGAAQPYTARLRSFLGLGIASWAVADATDKILTVEPQESFRGMRLIVDVAIAAAVTNSPIVLVRTITVGTMPQSPSVEQPAPAALFRADATLTMLDLQVAYRSIKLSLTLGITAAPTGAGVVTAAAGFYGEWIR